MTPEGHTAMERLLDALDLSHLHCTPQRWAASRVRAAQRSVCVESTLLTDSERCAAVV